MSAIIPPPPPAGRRRQVSARQVVTRRLLTILLLLTLILGACFAVALRRADDSIAQEQLANASHHFLARIESLEQSWLMQADIFRGQLEFNRVLDGPDHALRQERFVAYAASFGGEAAFSHVSVVDARGHLLYAYQTRTQQRLPQPPASDQPLAWIYGTADKVIYRAISERIHVPEGPARLILYVPLDNALLENNVYPGTHVSLLWQGRTLASSHPLLADAPNTTRIRGELAWGPQTDSPRLLIERRVTLPFSYSDLVAALLVAVVLIMLAGWLALGRWFDGLAQRLALLNDASKRFYALSGSASAPPAELDRVVAASRDELAQLALGLREMMSRVIEARGTQERARVDLTHTLGELRHAQEASNAALDHLEATLQALPDLLLELDAEGLIIDARFPHGQDPLGLGARADAGPIRIGEILPARAAEAMLRALQQAASARPASADAPIEMALEVAGKERCFELTAARMTRQSEVAGNFIVLARDITARKEAEARIERLAYFDTLTGLPNRRLLLDRLEHALAGATRRGSVGALMFIDLDNFKLLNDTRGHHLGDLLLCEVATRLTSAVRAEDSVARLGGDEFVVLFDALGHSEDEAHTRAAMVGENLLAVLNESYLLQGSPYHSGASIGVSLFHGQGESPDDVLKRADAAMYRAKDAGRNGLRFYDAAAEVAFEARLRLETELRRALPQGELRLHYQPQFAADGTLVGAEALLRWQHPERGLLAPGEFIHVAESNGLIVPIGEWVLDAACSQLHRWDQAGLVFGALRMAVNVSARQFAAPEFVSQVRSTLAREGVAAHRLKLELTESLVMESTSRAASIMEELRELGVAFSLDDFGTGYSSLAYLPLLPLDELKIDKSFVHGAARNTRSAAIVQTIIAMAEGLGLGVIAEGVETREQLDFLTHRRCHVFQGYYFGHPLPAEAFAAAWARPPGKPAAQASMPLQGLTQRD